jgi:hypothetical protein
LRIAVGGVDTSGEGWMQWLQRRKVNQQVTGAPGQRMVVFIQRFTPSKNFIIGADGTLLCTGVIK